MTRYRGVGITSSRFTNPESSRVTLKAFVQIKGSYPGFSSLCPDTEEDGPNTSFKHFLGEPGTGCVPAVSGEEGVESPAQSTQGKAGGS